jgi:hypothetical protein
MFGILMGTNDRLLKIASDCKDDGLKFSFVTIQQHVYFRRTTRHLLAMLVNEAGGNVSVLCPLEHLAVVAIEYRRRWQLFYDSLDSKMVSPEHMQDLCGIVSRATRQFGLCDCTKESVEYFCNRLEWPQQQLIVDVFDLFHKTSPSFHSSNISESLVN